MHLLCVSCISINSMFQKILCNENRRLRSPFHSTFSFPKSFLSYPLFFSYPSFTFPSMPYPWGTKNRYHQSYLVKWNVLKTQVPVRDNVRQNNTDALAACWTGQWSSVIIGELLCLWARISGTQADSEHIMQLQMTTNLGWSWASCGRA